MDKSKKLYIKALDKYNNGYIDKAIELSEESISIDIKNAASINLKGLLYYLKGDLDAAQSLWKMNYGVNKDEVSERYLSDTKKDKEKLDIYIPALTFINELKINDALSLLEKCAESDFNYINVNNHIALCYLRSGQYDKALKSTEKVFSVDRNNIMAREIMRTLKTYGGIKKDKNKIKAKYILISLALLIILSIVSIAYSKLIKSNNHLSIKNLFTMTLNKSKEIPKNAANLGDVKKNKEDSNKAQKDGSVPNKPQSESFPTDKVQGYIEDKNYEAIYEVTVKWKDKPLAINDKVILSKANEILKSEGVSYFYNKGCSYMNSNDYNSAKTYLLKAYEIGNDSYLYPHIIYMVGSAFYSSGDAENAIKYYTQYDQNFSVGNYEDTVLYNLTIIYKDTDKPKAKEYAERIIQNYPESIYNNSIVKDIINR